MKITLIGMNNFLNASGIDLFANLRLPDGIDKDVLIDNILCRAGDFGCVYTDAYFVMRYIGTWSRKWKPTFSRWVKAANIDYNPLENYDRIEEYTDSTNSVNSSTSNTDTSFKSDGSGVADTTQKDDRSAEDSDIYQPVTQTATASSSSDNFSSSTIGSVTSAANDTTDSIHKGRLHGNIGVTTSQQMLQSEYDIARFNIIEQITDIFIQEFCICIY